MLSKHSAEGSRARGRIVATLIVALTPLLIALSGGGVRESADELVGVGRQPSGTQSLRVNRTRMSDRVTQAFWKREGFQRWSLNIMVPSTPHSFEFATIRVRLNWSKDLWDPTVGDPTLPDYDPDATYYDPILSLTSDALGGVATSVTPGISHPCGVASGASIKILQPLAGGTLVVSPGVTKLLEIESAAGDLAGAGGTRPVYLFYGSEISFRDENNVALNFPNRDGDLRSGFSPNTNHKPTHTVDLDGDLQQTFGDYYEFWGRLDSFPTTVSIQYNQCPYDSRRDVLEEGKNNYSGLNVLGRRLNGGSYIGDANGDRVVDAADYLFVESSLGMSLLDILPFDPSFPWAADLNDDQTVDEDDLAIVLQSMGDNY